MVREVSMIRTSVRKQRVHASHFLARGLVILTCSGCPLEEDGNGLLDGDLALDAGAAPRFDASNDAPPLPSPAPSGDAGVQRPTHSGLISIQELSFPGLPAVAGGITVQALFTPASRPDYEEKPGEPTGCRAWSYDIEERPPPTEEDHGTLELAGFVEGSLTCRFDPARGYVCRGDQPGDSTTTPSFPFVARTFAPAVPLSISLAPAGKLGFAAFSAAVSPGEPFVPSAATRALLENVPTTGVSMRLDCSGEGGRCGEAAGTIVRITTTDADVSGADPTSMPRALRKYVEISCATLGGDVVTIPTAAMELLQRAHTASPMTRIRTAYMRDGIALVMNEAPNAPNRVVLATGRAVVGFTEP